MVGSLVTRMVACSVRFAGCVSGEAMARVEMMVTGKLRRIAAAIREVLCGGDAGPECARGSIWFSPLFGG